MNNVNNFLNQAKELPTHVDGQLADHYTYLNGKSSIDGILYSDNATPASIFRAIRGRKNSGSYYYINTIQTYREDGSMKPKKEWEEVLFFHKKYARRDVRVTDVTFDIVGLKRQTTQLPHGVLISNVKFIH